MDIEIKQYNSLRDLKEYKDALNKQLKVDENEIKRQHSAFIAHYR